LLLFLFEHSIGGFCNRASGIVPIDKGAIGAREILWFGRLAAGLQQLTTGRRLGKLHLRKYNGRLDHSAAHLHAAGTGDGRAKRSEPYA